MTRYTTLSALGLCLMFACGGDDEQTGDMGMGNEGSGGGGGTMQRGGDAETSAMTDSSAATASDMGLNTAMDSTPIMPDLGGQEPVNQPDSAMGIPGDGTEGKRCEPEPDEGHLFTMQARSLTRDEDVDMCDYRDKVTLFVNTAANCGFTPQFEHLEALNRAYRDRSFEVLGFLSNDFANQGGSLEEVEQCTERYMVTFEQYYHVGVTSRSADGQHPIFQWLTTQAGYEGDVPWNFSKFLVSHDGRLIGRWDHMISPNDPQVLTAIENALNEVPLAP